MLLIFNTVLPVFAILALGYLAVRLKFYPMAGIGGLVVFVNNFATPCLLFYAMLTSDFGTIFHLDIIVPFYIGALIAFVVGTLVAAKYFRDRPGESVSAGFSAMFTNTVLIGIPIVQRAYGEAALPLSFSIIALHAPMLITIGMLTMELMRRDGQPIHRALTVALLRIVQNPLMWGIVLGVLGNHFHLVLPEPGTAFVTMMSAAVLPVALFGLGGALNEYRLSDNWGEAAILSILKLIVHPLIAYVLMVPLLHVPIELARIGVLLAAMPSGINSYVFATYYNRGINVASNTILISTAGSVLTVTAWLYLLG